VSKTSASKRRIYGFCVVSVLAILAVALLMLAPAKHQTVHAALQSRNIATPNRTFVQAQFAALPVAFERNDGQTDAQVKYMARGQGYKLYLTSSEAILKLHKRGENSEVLNMIEDKRLGPAKVQRMLQQRRKMNAQPSQVAVVHMKFFGSNASVQVAATEPEQGKINYFIGNDPSKWHSNVPLFGRVSYRNIYPGVDLAFHGAGKQLEFDYLVSPGADPGSIALGFKGAEKMSTNATGDLILATSAGPIEMRRPVAYQEKDGVRQNIDARFELRSSNEVAFSLGSYDRTRDLVIDPTVTYSTYFGGDAADYGLSVVADAGGDAFVAGATDSDSIPGNSSGTVNESFDVFVTEISSSGGLDFTTVFGGSGDDFPGFPNALAIDSSGIYVAGTTASSDFPVTTGAAQTTFQGGTTNGDNDAFAVKLSVGGSAITWGTYIGGNDSDSGLGLAVDTNENVYVVGETYSTNLPVKNALPSGSTLNQNSGSGDDDGYIAVLNSTGSAFSLVSYIGGSNGDIATAVALDGSGNAYVTGATLSADLPVTSGAVQSSLSNATFDNIFVCSIAASSFTAANPTSNSIFVAKANATQKKSARSGALALWLPIPALALFGSFWCSADSRRRKLGGITLLCLALTVFIFMPACGGSSSNGGGGGGGGGGGSSTSSYIYMTYYGGNNLNDGIAIAVDSTGDAYVTGQTASTNFPVTSTTYQSTLAGAQNSFLLELNPTGTAAIYSSYFGGNGTEFGLGIALDGSGNVYLTGQTSSNSAFPLAGATQGTFGGATDAYVSVLNPSSNTLVFSTYLGGGGDEDQVGGSIAVSSGGGFYVTGDTDSGNNGTSAFPTLNALDATWGGGTCLNEAGTSNVPCPNGFVAAYTAP
jgi:Beta-propeller repeat